MLQRIQTIYLLLAGFVLAGLYIWFPVITTVDGVVLMSNQEPLVFGLIFTCIALIIIAALTFKKRQTQFVLNRLNIILNFVLLGVFVYRSLSIPGETLVSQKGIGVLLPIISIVFLAMANKAIKKDEDLVKSVDRLR
jgi:membrane protease YdiL (CAAX protease family)